MYCFISAVPAAFYWACWHTSIPKLDRITYIFLLVLEEYVHLLLLQCLQTLLQITQERAHLIWSLCHAHVQNKRRVCRKVQQISFLQETNTFIIIIITTVVLLLLLLLLTWYFGIGLCCLLSVAASASTVRHSWRCLMYFLSEFLK